VFTIKEFWCLYKKRKCNPTAINNADNIFWTVDVAESHNVYFAWIGSGFDPQDQNHKHPSK
jgi:hypothetical protein